MNSPPNPLVFLVVFPLGWLAVTTILSFRSGGFGLMGRYPVRDEVPIVTLTYQSGMLGLIAMRSILTLSICPGGLRIGIIRLFGPCCRDFLVPWNEISVVRANRILWKVAKLTFGQPANGTLRLSAEVADRIARLSVSQWPEPGPFPLETNRQGFLRITKEWAAVTCLAAAFFTIVPRLMAPNAAAWPPILVAILFPAIVFGGVAFIRYFRRPRT